MEALGLNLGYLFVQITSFLVMLIILRAWVYKPLVNMLENRQKKLAQSLEDARVAADARANAEVEVERILNEARAKAASEAGEITRRAEVQARDIVNAAQEEIHEARENAMEEAEMERNRLLSEVRGQIASLAISASQKLIGEALDEQRQRALIADFFSGIKDGKVAVLEGADVSGEKAHVTSALPLTDSEMDTVKSQFKGSEVEFAVNPVILGGLVVRVGDRVLDGSVSGQLEDLRKNLK